MGKYLFTGTAGAIKSAGVQLCHRGPPFQVELITLQMYNSMFVRAFLPPGEKARIFSQSKLRFLSSQISRGINRSSMVRKTFSHT